MNTAATWSDEIIRQYSLTYNNVFNRNHNFSAIVIFESISNYGTDLRQSFVQTL
ncbi:MAG: hypothetical protein LBR48_06700 [Dysgonamonadaceae bacterium]|nr:hypothetical protein [Dysgonamonadaceae bacterium]